MRLYVPALHDESDEAVPTFQITSLVLIQLGRHSHISVKTWLAFERISARSQKRSLLGRCSLAWLGCRSGLGSYFNDLQGQCGVLPRLTWQHCKQPALRRATLKVAERGLTYCCAVGMNGHKISVGRTLPNTMSLRILCISITSPKLLFCGPAWTPSIHASLHPCIHTYHTYAYMHPR